MDVIVVCCQGASETVVPVVAVDDVEEPLVEVVDPVVPVVPDPLVVLDEPVVLDPLTPLVEVPNWSVVEVLDEVVESSDATTDVSGRSVTSAPAALTAT